MSVPLVRLPLFICAFYGDNWPVAGRKKFRFIFLKRYFSTCWFRISYSHDSPMSKNAFFSHLNPRPDGVWRVTRPDGGWPKGPPLRIFKSKSRRAKIQTAMERSRQTLQDKIMLTLFFDLWRHRKVKEGQKRSKCAELQQPTVCHVKQTCLIKWS